MKEKTEEHTPPYGLGGVVLDVAVDPIEEEQPCTHQGHYRLAGGSYCAIRMCVNCGKSWRIWMKGDFPGECPVAEWEPIKEGLEVEERVVGNYDEAEIYTEDDEIEQEG